jgi:hypothetical protein
MKEISENKSSYNSFFRWKKYVVFEEPLRFSPKCSMCIELNLEQYFGIKKSVIEDVNSYWNVEKDCKNMSFQN